MKKLNLIYYDPFGNHVGRHSVKIKQKDNLPTHHLKNLIHHHLPIGYQVAYNFIYPQQALQDIYVAVQESAIYY